jgi:hypothetical protein
MGSGTDSPMPPGRDAGAALTVEYIEDANLRLQEHELEMKRIILIATGDERAIMVERPVGDLLPRRRTQM